MKVMRTLTCLLLAGAVLALAQTPQPRTKAFVGARIIDGTGRAAIENGTILVRDGRVESVGPSSTLKVDSGTERIDVTGKTVIPGIVNAHGHVGETRGMRQGAELYTRENVLDQLGLYSRYGITTVFSLGGDQAAGVAIRDAQNTPSLSHARLYVSGPVLTPQTPENAVRMVDQIAAMKVDFAKIRVDDNLGTGRKMPPAVYQAVIDHAHRKGIKVAAHMYYLEDAKALLRAGVDLLAHSVRDKDVDADLIRLLKERNVCLSPTLTREVSTFVYEKTPDFFSEPFFTREQDPAILEQLKAPQYQQNMANSKSAQAYKAGLVVASRNVKALTDAGVRVAMGTDTGPPARFQGYFEHMEMELMAKAGLTPMQVLVASTRDAAACMGNSTAIGTIEPGKWADLVVLGSNPLNDIRNTKSIESVWIAGNRVARK